MKTHTLLSVDHRLPVHIREKLANPPRAGSGVHRWLFTMGLQLHRLLSHDAIVKLLAKAVTGCGRDVPIREIEEAVTASKLASPRGPSPAKHPATAGAAARPKWPEVDTFLRAKIIGESSTTVADLQHRSPLAIEGDALFPNWYLEHLYPEDALLCIGTNRWFRTLPREYFMSVKFEESCLLVPSPMSEQRGVTKAGKESMHSLANTGPRRYLVTEFDSGTPDEQVAIIEHLAHFAPLVMVLSSGGKSLHAWWNCVEGTEEDHLRFFRYAVSLDADPATWTRSQFVRLPQAWRADKNARQAVYYFDPDNRPADSKGGLA